MSRNMCILLYMILLHSSLYIPTGALVNSTCSSSKDILTCNYVPAEIPDGVLHVYIKDFAPVTEFELNHELFQSKNWENVKSLEFVDNSTGFSNWFRIRNETFYDLKKLEHLRISCRSRIDIECNAFKGLNNVKQLDFSECMRLSPEMLIKSLNGSEKVPILEKLKLSGLNYFGLGSNINRSFSRCLAEKPLKALDLSRTHAAMFNFEVLKDLKHLKDVNISRTVVDDNEIHSKGLPTAGIDSLDISYARIARLISPYSIYTYANLDSQIDIRNLTSNHYVYAYLLSTRTVIADGFNHGPGVLMYNINAWIVGSFKALTKQLILKQNKLKRLDIKVECNNLDFTSLEVLDLAENEMEYLHPSLIACFRGLKNLDLSDNNLNAMQMENAELFSQLLNGSEELQHIKLVTNQLTDLPDKFFEGSENLATINLANNRLTQVHFKLSHLKFLSYIDLSRNDIKILDSTTMKQLDELLIHLEPSVVVENAENKKMSSSDRYIIAKRQVRLSGNPFSCDTCETLSSINWLVSTKLIESRLDELTCKGERDTNVSLNNAVGVVRDICDRKIKIIVPTISCVVFVTSCACTYLFIRYRRKRAKKQKQRNDVIEILRQDETQFALFLSFCNDDVDFVTEHIIEPLNRGLQQLVGTDRNLICLGDAEFCLGRYVHDQSLRYIELSTVFLCVVSDSYCNSVHCVQEFDQATEMRKPVILMMKGEVNIGLMTPAMEFLFQKQVRMLWENNNGEYRLKTTWENVCESIIDIATN